MNVDVLYLCHGRLEFTQATLPTLIANTDWSSVSEFVIYNDAEPDSGTTWSYLEEATTEVVVTLRRTNRGSPVGVMNHFLRRSNADAFAKIDNDIVVPPGWLDALRETMEGNEEIELLGAQPGMSGFRPGAETEVDVTAATHIGGVGLMRRSAFRQGRSLPVANGRFGFTEWQHEHLPGSFWICPDLRLFELDRLPVEPWRSLREGYVLDGGRALQREWPRYKKGMADDYWAWFTG